MGDTLGRQRLDSLERRMTDLERRASADTPSVPGGPRDYFIGIVNKWQHDRVTVLPIRGGDPSTTDFPAGLDLADPETEVCGVWVGRGQLIKLDYTTVFCFRTTIGWVGIVWVDDWWGSGENPNTPELPPCEPNDVGTIDPPNCDFPPGGWNDINCP